MPRKAVKKESSDGYIRVVVPEEMIEKVDELVERGLYRSRAEVVRDALRRYFERLKEE